MRQGPAQSATAMDPGGPPPVATVHGVPRAFAGRLAVVAIAAAFVAMGVTYVAVQLAVPSSGTHVRPGAEAFGQEGIALAPLGSSAVLEGDVLVAVEGIRVRTLARRVLDAWPGTAGTAAGGSSGAALGVEELRARWRAGESVDFEVLRGGALVTVDVELRRHPVLAAALRTWGTILFAFVTMSVATLVFMRRPDHPPARVLFVSGAALVAATTWSLGLRPADVVVPVGFWLFQATTVAAFMIYWTSLLHFTLVFPRRLRVATVPGVVPLLYGAPFAVVAGYLAVRFARADSMWSGLAVVAPVTGPHAAAFLFATLVTVTWQYASTRSAMQRRQVRWVVLAGIVAGVAGLFLYILPPLVGAEAVSPNVIGGVVTTFPVAIAIAVLRHQLFDIDALLRRTLVYGLLTFAVAALYVGVVAVAGAVLPTRAGRMPALVATLVAALALQPVRDRIQRWVNRWWFGERDEPATVLSRLGARLEDALAPGDVLPTLVQTVAQTLKLPYVAIDLGSGPDARTAAEFGRPGATLERFPLTYRSRPLGTLAVERRSTDEPFTPMEAELLATIARQAGVAAYAVQTTADLRRSRERLVAAREEERRRLRRDLHDGLGPALAGLALKLDAAANVVGGDAAAARSLLGELRDQVQVAVDDLRRVVHALRPPALDDLGLAGALREHVRAWDGGHLRIAFDAPRVLPPVPAATEVAAYRIVQEALANVVRHAGARSCRVVLRSGADLEIVVEDDGSGIPPDAVPGVGLPSMRERAEEVGGAFLVERRRTGGTRVRATLPLEASE